eukprot:TRINITY_DN15967_c0_g2_i1.p1 TRINITY_DN15967_c0_g2~~TRINITY_DN15967_c0_g2_i1.p1  ORF type:complete len:310 (+),score=61.02 TRINITY_DN15967_c0_g2_i1:30-932(+)
MASPVTVNCISGGLLHFQLDAEDCIDNLKQHVAEAWPEPALSRNVCLLTASGDVPSGTSLVVDHGSEFTAVVSQRQRPERDANAHADAIMDLPEEISLVFIGDGRRTELPGVGKTSLIFRCRESLATTFCSWSESSKGMGGGRITGDGTVRFHGCEYGWSDSEATTSLITFIDSVSGEELRRESPSLFVICFSLACRSSFERVANEWIHEVLPKIPVILVGTKVDLAESSKVSFQEGQAMARQIGALDYIECSSRSGEGVDDVLESAMWAVLLDSETDEGRARLAAKDVSCFQDDTCAIM